ncbi:hypothetical protein ANTRET_LOCUS7010 [Anthophora retusa]
MEDRNVHFRHILLYYFRKGKNARQVCAKLREVYDENALKERQYLGWFQKFRVGDFELNDTPWSGRPTDKERSRKVRLRF